MLPFPGSTGLAGSAEEIGIKTGTAAKLSLHRIVACEQETIGAK
jgi:hypothetical protein